MEMHSTESWVFHECPKGQRDDGEPCMAVDEVMYRLLSITWHIGSDCLQSIWQQMLRGFHTSSNILLNPYKAFYIPGPCSYYLYSPEQSYVIFNHDLLTPQKFDSDIEKLQHDSRYSW